MKRVTIDGVLALGPCAPYTRERVEALWDGRASLSPAEIAALDIPHTDRAWALVRLIPRRARVAWACDCAERVLPVWHARYPQDRRPQDAIRIARLWLRGEATREEVRAAYASAYAAAYAASAYAYADASASAYAAAYAAAAAAASASASADAAAAAAYAAYAAAKRHEEQAWQLARLVEYAEGRVKP